MQVAKIFGLGGAARGVVFGVKIQHDCATQALLQCDLTDGALYGENGGGGAQDV
jgi:hypothetical protein